MNDFGQWLVQSRESKNLSQSDLAQRLGVSPRSITRWETRETPTNNMVRRIAKFFGEDEDALVDFAAGKGTLRPRENGSGIVVPFYAERYAREAAMEAGMSPEQWVGRLIDRIKSSPPLVQSFIKDAVREGFDPSFGSTHPQDSKRPQGSHA